MISYELAKKLKDAGFPQEYRKTDPLMDFAYCPEDEISGSSEKLHMLHTDNDTDWWIGNDYNHREMTGDEMVRDWVKCPALSELIEACDTETVRFVGIHKQENEDVNRHERPFFWSAAAQEKGKGDSGTAFLGGSDEGIDEAVANLFLTINRTNEKQDD